MRKRAFPISSHFSPTSKSAMPLNYPCLSSCLTTASVRAFANTSLPPRPGTRILEANLLFHLTRPWDASPGCLPEPPGQPQAPVKSLEIKDLQNRADFGRAVSPAALRPAHSRCPQQLLETPMTSPVLTNPHHATLCSSEKTVTPHLLPERFSNCLPCRWPGLKAANGVWP